MGGDHGHHHHGVMKVPDWKVYKVEEIPELMTLKNALAQKGLKDPWLRNEVWRFQTKEWGTTGERWRLSLLRGFKWGFLAFVATVAIEKGLEAINPPKHDHHGHH